MEDCLGFDFGTSNTSVAHFADGQVKNIDFNEGRNVIPTAVFFDADERKMIIGDSANESLVAGFDGRYMRSLKSVLGTSLMEEKQWIIGKQIDLYQIISDFIIQVKNLAELSSGKTFRNVVAGRPVFFHHLNDDKDKAAENDLRCCFQRAGFSNIEFMYEPEAAALNAAKNMQSDTVGLVVDIGGGTSDFTVFKKRKDGFEIISSNGIRLGGTDFDRKINYEYIMPFLGRGRRLNRRFNEGTIEAPNGIFLDLSTWEKIHFLYNKKTVNLANELMRDAIEPTYFSRLVKVIEGRLGHDLAFEAENIKIRYNIYGGDIRFNLGMLGVDSLVEIGSDDILSSLKFFESMISDAALETLQIGAVDKEDVSVIIPVGGSSQMAFVKDVIGRILPNASHHMDSIFTSVSDGLAIKAGQ